MRLDQAHSVPYHRAMGLRGEPCSKPPTCEAAILTFLRLHPNRYVTPGWLGDRGLGFTEYQIGQALRSLAKSGHIAAQLLEGMQKYAVVSSFSSRMRKADPHGHSRSVG